MAALAAILPILRALLALATSRVGQLLIVSGLAFGGGWSLKAKLDRSATMQAVINKQRIDLKAAQDAAAQANAVANDISASDANNQEIIRDLQTRLAQRPAGHTCTLDPAAADSLRRLR